MSAEVVELPTPLGADDIVRRTVRGLAGLNGLKLEQVAAGAGIPKSTFTRKLRSVGEKQQFTAGEVAALAAFFGVEVGVLFSGLGLLSVPLAGFEPATHGLQCRNSARTRGHLTLLASEHDAPVAPQAPSQPVQQPQRPVRHLSVVRAA